MLLRGALIGALLSWVAARATTAAGQLFLPVPLLGYFRADAGLLLVALACTAAALLPWRRLLPATCVGLAGPMALFAVGLDPPRFRHGGDKPVQVLNGSTAYFVSVAGALSPAECAALVRAVWDVRTSWTHASHAGALRACTPPSPAERRLVPDLSWRPLAGALAYFHFPWSANFDKGDDPAEARCHVSSRPTVPTAAASHRPRRCRLPTSLAAAARRAASPPAAAAAASRRLCGPSRTACAS